MRRADRLFDIIQILRTAVKPVTAAALAGELEVNVRTVYRDVATLQARRVPIEGAAGIGYLLRKGFDLPPLMFTTEEVDAIVVGAQMLKRIRDPQLQQAAESVLAKVAIVLPDLQRRHLATPTVYVADGRPGPAPGVDLSEVRSAIHENRKMRVGYTDEKGATTQRTIWPIAMAYYTDATLIGAWCELRQDYRHFRVDRIASSRVLEERFPADNGRLMKEWLSLRQGRAEAAH